MKKQKKIKLLFASIVVLIMVALILIDRKQEIPMPYQNSVTKDGLKLEYKITQEEDGYVLINADITNTTDKKMAWPEKRLGYLVAIDVKTKNDIKTTLRIQSQELLNNFKNVEKPRDTFMYVGSTPTLQAGETEFFERRSVSQRQDKFYEGDVEYIISYPEYKIILKGEIENKKLKLYKEKIVEVR